MPLLLLRDSPTKAIAPICMQEKEAVRHLLLPHIHLHTLPEGFSGPNVLVPLLLPHMALLLLLLLLLLVNTSMLHLLIPPSPKISHSSWRELKRKQKEKEVARAKSFTISKFSLRTGEETIRDADPREALKMVDTAQATRLANAEFHLSHHKIKTLYLPLIAK